MKKGEADIIVIILIILLVLIGSTIIYGVVIGLIPRISNKVFGWTSSKI